MTKVIFKLLLVLGFQLPALQASAQVTSTATAASADSSIQIPQLRPYKDELKAATLKKHGFILEGDQLKELSKTAGAPATVLGKILVIDAKEVYEWADVENQEDWLKDGEIKPAHLKLVLADPGQAAGKGFYVSLDPTDSSSYGPVMTVFRPQKSIVVLEYIDELANKVGTDTAFVQSLSDAGIHALRYKSYSPTWLSIIHPQVLKGAGLMSKELFEKLAMDIDRLPMLIQKTKNLPIQEFLKNSNLPVERQALLNGQEPTIDVIKAMVPLAKVIPDLFLEMALKVLAKAKTQAEYVEVLKQIKNLTSLWDHDKFIPSLLIEKMNPQQAEYSKMLEYFSLSTIAKGAKSEKLMPAFRAALAKYKQNLEKIDVDQVNTADDFIAAVKVVFGNQIEIRTGNKKVYRQFSGGLDIYKTPKALEEYLEGYLDHRMLLDFDVSDLSMGVGVSYVNLQMILSLQQNFSVTLRDEIKDFIKQNPVIDPNSVASAGIQKKAVKEILEMLMNGQGAGLSIKDPATSELKYIQMDDFIARAKVLAVLQPFTQSNLQISMFMRDLMNIKYEGYGYGLQTEHPIEEMRLYSLNGFGESIVYHILRRAILDSKDDQEFLTRCQQAMKIFFEVFPDQKTLFPELAKF
jgi:hypothetical protein